MMPWQNWNLRFVPPLVVLLILWNVRCSVQRKAAELKGDSDWRTPSTGDSGIETQIYDESTSLYDVEQIMERKCSLDANAMCWDRSVRQVSACHSVVSTVDPVFASVLHGYAVDGSTADQCHFTFRVNNASDLPIVDEGHKIVVINDVLDIIARHVIEDLYVTARAHGLVSVSPASSDDDSQRRLGRTSMLPPGRLLSNKSERPSTNLPSRSFPAADDDEHMRDGIQQYIVNFMQSLSDYLNADRSSTYTEQEQLTISIEALPQNEGSKSVSTESRRIVLSDLAYDFSALDLDSAFRVAVKHYKISDDDDDESRSREPSGLSVPDLVADTSLTVTDDEYVNVFDAIYLPMVERAIDGYMKDKKGRSRMKKLQEHSPIPPEQLRDRISDNKLLNDCLRQHFVDGTLVGTECQQAIELGSERMDKIMEERRKRDGWSPAALSGQQRHQDSVYHGRQAELVLLAGLLGSVLLLAHFFVFVADAYALVRNRRALGYEVGGDSPPSPTAVVQEAKLRNGVRKVERKLILLWSVLAVVGSTMVAPVLRWSSAQLSHFGLDAAMLLAAALLVLSIGMLAAGSGPDRPSVGRLLRRQHQPGLLSNDGNGDYGHLDGSSPSSNLQQYRERQQEPRGPGIISCDYELSSIVVVNNGPRRGSHGKDTEKTTTGTGLGEYRNGPSAGTSSCGKETKSLSGSDSDGGSV